MPYCLLYVLRTPRPRRPYGMITPGLLPPGRLCRCPRDRGTGQHGAAPPAPAYGRKCRGACSRPFHLFRPFRPFCAFSVPALYPFSTSSTRNRHSMSQLIIIGHNRSQPIVTSRNQLQHAAIKGLMLKGPLPRKHHGHLRAGLVHCLNHLMVAHGAAGLGNGGNAVRQCRVHAVAEGEKAV